MSDPAIIPPAIRRYLRRHIVRRRATALLRAIATACIVVILWALIWAIVDRLLPLPAFVRVALLVIVGIAVARILFHPLQRVLSPRLDWIAAASQIERADRRFVGRLETAVSQLLLPASNRGSSQLVERIVSEADTLARDRMMLSSVAVVYRSWLIAIALLLAMFALCSIEWLDLPTLLQRQLHPLASIGSVTSTRIAVEPGGIDVPQGQNLTIRARTTRGAPSPLQIRICSGDGEFATQAMTETNSGEFTYALGPIDRDWQYDISGGDARSELYTVRVLRRPGVVQFRTRCIYPGYMNRPASSRETAGGAIDAPVGTQVTVELVPTEPLASAALMIDGQRVLAQRIADTNAFAASFQIARSATYRVELRSLRGVTHVSDDIPIHAQADQPPVVQWRDRENLRLSPLDQLTVKYRASDDFGATSASVTVRVNEKPLRSVVVPAAGAITLALPEWDVKVGDVVEVTIQASDARQQLGVSSPLRIIVSPLSVGAEGLRCVAELEKAARLSGQLAESLSDATRGADSPQTALSSPSITTQRLRAAELSEQIAGHLVRALAACDRDDLQAQLAQLLQTSAAVRSNLHAAAQDRRAIRQAEQSARGMRDHVRILAPAEQARLIRLDLFNFDHLLRLPQSSGLSQALQLAGKDVDSAIQQLGLEPDDDRLVELLDAKIQIAQERASEFNLPNVESPTSQPIAAVIAAETKIDGPHPNAFARAFAYPWGNPIAAYDHTRSSQQARRDSMLIAFQSKLPLAEMVKEPDVRGVAAINAAVSDVPPNDGAHGDALRLYFQMLKRAK